MVLPDPDDEQRKILSWLGLMRGAWRYLGFVVAGMSIPLVFYAKVEYAAVGVPESFTILNNRPLWITIGVLGLVFSLWACGRHVLSRVTVESAKARKQIHQELAHAIGERDKWKRQAGLNEQETKECQNMIMEMQRKHGA
jgi:hypothetical protein